jgi:hypothetical protein
MHQSHKKFDCHQDSISQTLNLSPIFSCSIINKTMFSCSVKNNIIASHVEKVEANNPVVAKEKKYGHQGSGHSSALPKMSDFFL